MHLIRISNYELPFLSNINFLLLIFSPISFTLLFSLISLFILFLIFWASYKLLILKSLVDRKFILLEVRPTEVTLQSNYSTEKLFSILYSLTTKRSVIQRIIKAKTIISLELVSTKNEGIRYIFRIPEEDSNVFKNSLQAYLPGIFVREIEDYVKDRERVNILTLKQSRSFIFPLKTESKLKDFDPIAYLTNQMTNLKDLDLVCLQILLTPVTKATHNRIIRKVNSIKKLSSRGESIIKDRNNIFLFSMLEIIGFSLSLLFSFIDFIFFSKNQAANKAFNAINTKKFKDLSLEEKEIQKAILSKLSHELFESDIRIGIVCNSKEELKTRRKGLISSFANFSNNSGQSLIEYKSIFSNFKNFKIFNIFFNFIFIHRIFSYSKNVILSTSELSSIYHFPFTTTTKTEDIIKVKSINLPAPLRFKKLKTVLDIIVGKNKFADKNISIGLTKDERRRHIYTIGATGTGKTTMLSQMIYQDIINGNGIAVIDPHGDLIQKLIKIIPEERIRDVVLFCPDDTEFPNGVNLLEIDESLSPSEAQKQKDFITSSVISIFTKLYPPKYFGPRMEYILRNSLLTALETENPTLFTVHRILTDDKFRRNIIARLKDNILKDFWINEFETLGDYQKNEVISPITNKLGRFLMSTLSRNILGQEKSTFNIEDIMNNKKILLCDLSKGKIGEDNSAFFGSIILSQIQLAALKRVRTPEEDRVDFYMYVDEFQNFATPSFAEILSEARKYRLNAILAHQTISQIEDKNLLKTILANSGTIISFRSSNPSDESLILPLFVPQVSKHDISNLPSYKFYIKIQTLESENAFTAETEKLSVTEYCETADKIIQNSRQNYAKPKLSVEQEILFPSQQKQQASEKEYSERRIF